MVIGLKVTGDSSGFLSITLKNVLECVGNPINMHWSLLWLKAFGALEPEGIIPLEQRINNSINGVSIKLSSLSLLANQVDQIIDIILIGSSNPKDLHRYNTDEEMYNTCDYCLELIDSSYWIMHSKNVFFIEKIQDAMDGVEFIL